MSGTKNIFFIYTKEDSALLPQVLDQLYPLKKEAGVSFWYDDPIYPGKTWYPQIVSRFEDADVYIVLVSNAFMHSSFVQQLEFKQVVDRYKNNGALLIPILINDCPWDVDFSSDEYTFSFKQLRVLPEAGIPLRSWTSPSQGLTICTDYIKGLISNGGKHHERVVEEAIGKAEIISAPDLVERPPEVRDETTTEVEVETESESTVGGIQDEQETEKVDKNDLAVQEPIEKPHSNVGTGTDHSDLEAEWREEQHVTEIAERTSSIRSFDVMTQLSDPRNRKIIGLGTAALILILLGSIVFSRLGNSTNEEPPASTVNRTDSPESLPQGEAISKTDQTIVDEKPEISTQNGAAAAIALAVGDPYGDGLIFEIDTNGKTGRVAHRNDLGPMIWTDALKIHEELGEGWRLPTHDELKSMYDVLGQGADNDGQFADDLYWSATPYDENQAKLVRFTDGNASYHYNSRGTHRQFLVRAVRDFERN